MKNKLNLAFPALLLILFPGLTFGQAKFVPMKDPAVFRHKLAGSSKGIVTLSSSFTQEKNLSVLSEKIISNGEFYFKKERNLRWEYSDPYPYLIIFSNDRIFIKDEEKVNKFEIQSNRMFSEINNILIGSVRGTLLDDEKSFKAVFEENSNSFLVKLQPLKPELKSYLSEIWLVFDRTTYLVKKLEMHESSGDYTRIEFTGIRLNQPISDEKFTVN
jgi:outer membrane lipoprotein-sorting protein